MKSDTPLDYAVFQLSPRHSHCELLVSSNGNIEKLASGLVKPFVTHLKVAEEQVAQAVRSIKLEVERRRNAEAWFTKGTIERFVRFVSTPEVLELVNTFDAEMSQLEAARRIYSQGSDDQLSRSLGGDGTGIMAGADATKKELLRAIDVRLVAVKQDLTMACARASAAGFNPDTVSELQLFADCFEAHRLNEACTKFISLCERRSDLISPWKLGVEDQVVRASWGSDMSIDDPIEDSSGSHNIKPHQPPFQNKQQHQHAGQDQRADTTQSQLSINQSKLSTCQQPSSSLFSQQQINQNENKKEDKQKEEAETASVSQSNQPARRLSVQDRINLFENKQKENSGGKPVAVVKSAELRRLSSDVSSASAVEKSVLRRWSGASDMSIDLGNDKKENNHTDSPLCTPSSSSVSQTKSNVIPGSSENNKEQKGLNNTASSVQVEAKSVSELKDQGELQTHSDSFVGNDEEVRLKGKDQVGYLVQLSSFTGRGEQVGADHLGEEKSKSTFGGEERSDGVGDQVGFGGKSKDLSDRGDTVALRNQSRNRIEDVEVKDQPLSQSRFRGSQTHSWSISGQFEGGYGLKPKEVPYRETEGDKSGSKPQWSSFAGEVEQVQKDTLPASKEPMKVEDLDVPKMKVQKLHSAGVEQIRKLQGRREESGPVYGGRKPVFPGDNAPESQESFDTEQTLSEEQFQRVRQSKGNQELNDELKMKANELEKLFAMHKLRVPTDQSSSTRRNKPTEKQVEQVVSSQHRKSVALEISPAPFPDKQIMSEPIRSNNDLAQFTTPPPVKMVENEDYSSSQRQNFAELSFSDDSRGKFYEKYMQKREGKLREQWTKKRAEKEAKLKALQDSLEQTRAEMKAKFSRSADRQDSVSTARRRAEKLRSFNFHSGTKQEQHPIDALQSEEDEDLSEFAEQKYLGDGTSKSSQNKKFLPNRNLTSSTPRTTATPVSRSSAKGTTSSGRRRTQSENPLTQSVPNFSDFKKENTKPSSGVSKTANRLQVRTYARSKSTNEEIPFAKEEKPQRSQSLKKSSASLVESKEFPASKPDAVLAPLKFDKEQAEQSSYDKFSKNVESKPFLRKGNGIGPGAGAGVAKLKASVALQTSQNEEEFEESPYEVEDLVGVVKEEEDEELEETMEVEDSANMDNGKPRLSQESDKMAMSGSENGDSIRSLSQIDPASVAELPASVPSTFLATGSQHESPGESPVSWNSRMHHPFSYPHEASDIDVSVDSPIGSPASWNSHSLVQAEAEAARMRKKWGSAQKPMLVANSFHNQPRKDVTKGFKRLLKFGRKKGGTESLVDWISATTSEGDDDTEDGRDPANRSSEDLRKSRMGFSQGHPSDDGFNDGELFNEQVQALQSSIPAPPANFKLRDDLMSGSSIKAPRSFFSLSSFRSKGSDSKPR